MNIDSTDPMQQMQAVNDAFWAYIHSTPGDSVFYKSIGTVLASIIICSVWTNTIRYYEYFGKTDRKWALGVVGLGCAIVTTELAMDLAQSYELSNHAFTDYVSIMIFDQTMDAVKAILATVLSCIANCFYAWRVYMLSGQRKIVLGILVVISIAVYSYAMFVSMYALCAPPMDLTGSENSGEAFMKNLKKYYHVSGALTMAHDLGLCITMIVLLWRRKTSLFNLEKRIFKKVASITFESMLPPVICILITEVASLLPQSDDMTTYYGWHKMFWPPLGPLYFHSLLLTLVSRKTLRRLLNEDLASNGVLRLGPGSSSIGKRSLPEPLFMTVEQTSAVTRVEPRTVHVNRSPVPEHVALGAVENLRLGGLGEKNDWKTSIKTVSTDCGGLEHDDNLDTSSVQDWDVEAHPQPSRYSRESDIPPFSAAFYLPGDAPTVPEPRVHPFSRVGSAV